MDKPSLSKITKLAYHKGYSLLELLIVMMIVGSILIASGPLLTYAMYHKDYTKRIINYEIINAQLTAIALHKNVSLKHLSSQHNIYFNDRGNINHAQSIRLSRNGYGFKLVFFLGFGRYEFR
jgi:prepilin-type N-terminal cleavage/methylation domain-containing protein